jgi:PAS domain S-box-containing protein
MEFECIGDVDPRDINAQYKILFMCAPDIIFLVDFNGKILDANHAAIKSYGYSMDELLSMNIQDFIVPSEHGFASKQLNEAYTKGNMFETVHQRKDGSKFPIEISARGIIVDKTKILISIARDITKRKEAERNLSRIAAIVESSDDAILGMTLDGIIIEWNQGAERIYGYTATEIIGKTVDLLIPKDHIGELSHIIDVIKHGGHVKHFDTVRIRKDGKAVHISMTASPIKSPKGELLGISWTARDITERIRDIETLRESEEKFRVIFGSAGVGISQVNLELRYTDVNQELCDLTGYSRDEMLKLSIKDITYPPDYEGESKQLHTLVEGKIKSYSIEKRFVRKDGSLNWISLNAAVVTDNGKPKFIIGVSQNIAKRKQAEEALNDAKAQIELYLDLISHDINNMNQIAIGFLELAQE